MAPAMPAYPREELEEMVRRWVAANNESGRTGDWSRMADFYTEDAIYTWNPSDRWRNLLVVTHCRKLSRRMRQSIQATPADLSSTLKAKWLVSTALMPVLVL